MPRLLSLVLCAQLIFAPVALAQNIVPAKTVTKTTTSAIAPASITRTNPVTATPIGLDLSSATRAQSATSLMHGTQTAVINVGGSAMTVTPNSLLTAAQFAALSQVLAGQAQALHVGANGTATGGSLCVSCSIAQQQLSSLVIPKGVQVTNDFSGTGALNVTGSLLNSGAFYAVSTKTDVTNAVINAQNISVAGGGLLTSVLPAGGLPGFNGAIANLGLTLNASQSLSNQGTISSATNLTIASPNIFNAGTIATRTGNISILNVQQLTQSSSGIIQAPSGTVSIIGNGASDVHVSGGSVFAKDVMLNAGCGAMDLSLKDASGNFSVTAGSAKIAVLDGTHGFNLLGVNTASDPDLIFNGTGNYTSAAFNSLGGVVDITTTGSITFSGAINTTPSTTGSGGYVNLNAGTTINAADITTSGRTNGSAGPITLTAGGAITTGNLTASGVGASGVDGAITVNGGSTFTAGTLKGDAIGLTTSGNLVTGAVTANSLSASTGGGNVATGTITANSSNVSTSGGNVVTGTITANSLNVSTGSGNFGSAATPINTAVGNLTLQTTGTGSAYVNQTGALTLNASTLGGDLKLLTNTSFTLGAPVTATNLTIQQTGSNNSITINSNPTVANTLTLTATGTGRVLEGAGVVLNPGSLVMSTGSGNFGSAGTPFAFDSSNLQVATTGSAWLTRATAGPVTLNASSAGSTLLISANGDITTNGTVSASTTTLQSTATNGNITIKGNLTGTSAVTLTATGSGNIDNPSGTITAGNLVMTSGTGDIGHTGFLNTAASSITANTGGSGSVQIGQTGAFTLQPSSAGNNFYVHINAPTFTLNNLVTAGSNLILTGTGSNTSFIINQNPSVGSQFGVLTYGTGTITESVVMTAPLISLATGSADLGSAGTPFQVSTSKLSLSAGANAYVSNDKNLTILNATVTKTFNLLNNGNITVSGAVATDKVLLQPTSANGSIILGANLTGTTSSQLIATGTGTITQTGGYVSGGTATLTTAGGAIGASGSPIKFGGATVNANSGAGAIFLDAQGNSTFNTVASGSSISITGSGGSVTTTGAITAPTISLQSSASGIAINSNVTATTSITVTGANSANISTSGGLLTAPSVALVASTGNIGAANAPITTATPSLTANTGGSVYVTNIGDVALGNSSAGSLLQVAASGNLHVSGTLTSSSLNLSTTASNGNILVDTALNAPSGLTMTSQGTGSITIPQPIVTTPTQPGNGGAVSITAGGALNYNSITTTANGTASGTAGSVSISAGGVVTGSGKIDTGIHAANQGVAPGSISISAAGVNVGDLDASSTVGSGAGITVGSTGALTISNVYTKAAGDGGTITIAASGPSPLVITGVIDSHSTSTTGKPGSPAGDVTLTSVNGVTVGGNIDVRTAGGKGGSLTVKNTGSGDITLPNINASSLGEVALGYDGLLNPSGGDVLITQAGPGNVNVNGAINTSGINTSFGGNVGIKLNGGALTVQSTINTTSAQQTGGHVDIGGVASAVSLNTLGAATDTAIKTSGGGTSQFYSGNVRILPAGAAINITGDINTAGTGSALSAGVVIDAANSINVNGNILASNGTSQGGNVLLQAAGNITANDITTNGVNGSGGIISIAAGTGGTGDLTVGNLSSTGSGADRSGGATTLSSGGNITVGTVTTNGAGGAFGGAVTMVAGYQPYGGNPGGSGDITYGNISSTGAWGGNVSIVSLGTSGNINNAASSITTNASGLNGIAGSVSISSPGAINLGSVSTQAMNGANAYAGSVFVSSGAAGNAITVSDINTSSSGTAGNVFLIANPTSTVTDNPANITQTGTTTNTISGTTNGYLFDNPAAVTPTTTISGTMTASFGTTVTGYNPGGYLTASDSSAQLTVNTNGDSRLFVPLAVLQGDATIQALNSQATTVGSNTYASPLAVYAAGNVTVTNPVVAISVNAPAAPVNFVSTTGTVSIPSLTIQGDPAAQVVLSSPTSFTLTNGSSIFNSANSTGGLVTISVPNGTINLGSPGNYSNNKLEANGTTGGIISLAASGDIVDYGVAINATGTTGNGGSVNISSSEGHVKFYNEYNGGSTIPAGINVSSTSGNGGTINIYGRYGVSVLADGTASTASTHVFQANGLGQGGTITISSPNGSVDLSDNQSVNAVATGAGGTGGSIYLFAPFGNVNVNNLNAASDNGGSIRSISSKFNLSNGNNITADGTNGLGGTVFLYTGGVKVGGNDIQLGTPDNRTGNVVSARGTTGGGSVTVAAGGSLIDYEVGITTDTTNGTGGTTKVYAGANDIKLYSSWWNNGTAENHNAYVSANSANGAGGQVIMDGHSNVLSLQDSSNGFGGNASTHAITATGSSAGGTITITGGNINLATTDQILATGSAATSTGGSITIQSNDATGPGNTICCYSNATSIINAAGGQIGGTIDIESTNGHIDLTQTSKVTTSATGTTGGATTINAPNGWVTVNNIIADVPGSTINISAGGQLYNVGTITGDVVDMRTVANGGRIALGAPVNGGTSVTMFASTSGDIENWSGYGGGLITAPTVSLTSQWSNVGQLTGGSNPPKMSQDPLFVFVNATNLTLNAGGNIYVNSTGSSVNLVGNSVAGSGNNNFILESNGDVNIPGTLTVGSTVNYSGSCCNGYSWVGNYGQGWLNVETYNGTGNINITGTTNGHGEAQFIAAGTGQVNLAAGAAINSDQTVSIQSYGANVQGNIYSLNREDQTDPNGVLTHYYGGSVIFIPNGAQSVGLGDATGSAATFDLPASVFGKITTNYVSIGQRTWNGTAYVPVNTGDIKLYGDVNIANALGTAGSYSLYIYTGGNFDGTGYKVALSTGANDGHSYQVTADNNITTGSASGGDYQSFYAGKTASVNGVLDNTNSAYQWNEVYVSAGTKVDVQSAGAINSVYSDLNAPLINVDGAVTGSLQTSASYSTYLANNVTQPAYGLTLSGTGSLAGPVIYIQDSHYTYDPVTYQSTFQGGKVTGTIGQLNGALSGYAPAGAASGMGVFSLYTTNGNMQIRDITASTIAAGTDGAHALTLLNTSGYSTTLSAGSIHLTSGTINANIGLSATAGSVVIDSPAGYALTMGGTNGTISIAGTASNTIQAASGTLTIQQSINAGTQTLNLISNGTNGSISLIGNSSVQGGGNINVQTPSLSVAAGSAIGAGGILSISNLGSVLSINNSGAIGSSNSLNITNDRDITITAPAGSTTGAPTVIVSTTAGAINLAGGLAATTGGMTLTATNGVTSTDTVNGLSTPTLNVIGGAGAISVAATSATNLTVSTNNTASISDTAGSVITVNPSSASSFMLSATAAASGILGNGVLNAPTVSLSAGSAGVDYTTGGSLNATTLSANTSGAVNIRDTSDSLISLGASSAGAIFTLNTGSSTGVPGSGITATGLLNAPTVNLTAGTGGIDFSTTGSMNASSVTVSDSYGPVTISDSYAGVITLAASSAQSISITATNTAGGIAGNGVLTAGTANFTAGTGGIDFSSNGSITAMNLTANAANGDVAINDTWAGVVSLGTSSANNFALRAVNGGIQATGALSTNSANLTAGVSGIDFSTSGTTNAANLTITDATGAVAIKDTYSGVINVAAGSAKSLDLQATDAASGISGSGAFSAPAVSLTAGSAGIDFSTSSSLNAKTLTVTDATGNVNITDTFGGNITLNPSSASSFTMTASALNSGITTNGQLTANSVNLSAGTGGITALTNASQLTVADATGTVALTDNFAGVATLNASTAKTLSLTMLDQAGGIQGNGALDSPTVSFTSRDGGIDFSTNGSINAKSLTISDTTGAANIKDTYSGLISLQSGTATSLNLVASDNASGIAGTGTFTSADVTLAAGSAGIDLLTGGSLDAAALKFNAPTGSVNIKDAYSGTVLLGTSSAASLNLTAQSITTAGTVTAPSMTFTTTGDLTSTSANPIVSQNVSVASTGNVSLVDASATPVTVSGNGSTFAFDATSADLTASSAVNGTTITLKSDSGNVVVAGTIGGGIGTTTDVSIAAQKAIINSSGTIKADVVNLSAGNDIGAANNRLSTKVGTINTSAAANEYLSGIGTTNVGTTNASGVLDFLNNGNIGVTGAVSSGGIKLQTLTGSNGAITIGANVSSTGAVALTTDGTGTVTVNAPVATTSGAVNINTRLLNLNSSVSDTDPVSGITVQHPASLTIVGPDNSAGTLSTSGGAINITSTGGTVHFDKSAGPNVATLWFLGGPTTINAQTVTVASGVNVQSNNNMTVNAGVTQNAGIMYAAQQLAIANSSGVSVTGTGILSGTTVALNSSNGAISVAQGEIDGIATGSAGTSYSITTTNNDLSAGNTTANNGSISLTANGFNLNVVDKSTIQASADVNLTGGKNVNLGTNAGLGVSVNSGTLDPTFDPYSTNRADFDITKVATPGGTMITSGTGVVLGSNVVVRSIGDSIGMVAQSGNITFGSSDQLFAQAGNVWLNSLGNVTLGSGARLTAVARDIPNSTFNIASFGDITNFRGGDIGINVGSMTTGYDNYLRTNFDAARDRNGINYSSAGVSKTNISTDVLHGGTINFTQNGAGKIVLANTTFTADGGVIQIDPPASGVNVGNATFMAIGPELTPLPPTPPAPTPTPVIIPGDTPTTPVKLVPNLTSLTSEIQSINQGNSARTVALDQTKVVAYNTILLPTDGRSQCTATYVPPYSEDGWSVAAGSCQSFAVKDGDDSAIIGGGGATLSSEGSRNISLKKGSMVAMAGRNGLTVTTSRGAVVEVPAESSVMVEETDAGVVRVIQLSGQQTKINLKGKENAPALSTTAGQEVVIADDDAPDEELIPVDGVERIAVSATLTFAGSQIKHNKFDAKRMIDQSKLLNCHQNCFPMYIRDRINKTRAAAMSHPPGPISQNSPATPLHPVAYVAPQAVATKPTANVISLDSDIAVVKHLGAKFTMMTPEEMKLEHGEIAVCANKPLIVHGGNFTASIEKGVIATVRYNNDVLQVRNISDATPHSVSVHSHTRTLDIPVGGEVMMAATEAQLDKELQQDNVGRRKIRRAEIDGTAVMSSEISFLSAISESALLNKLYLSEEEEDKEFRQKVTKTAVILSIVTARHGTFAPIK